MSRLGRTFAILLLLPFLLVGAGCNTAWCRPGTCA
jgi:hypothetical protein